MSKIKDLLARAISLASEQPMSYKEVIELLDGIDTCKVKIWLEEGAKLPEYAHKEDACMDLFVKDIELDGGRIIYHTGVHVALPKDYEMEIRPRSGFTNSELIMQNAPATIDEGYSGEIMIVHRKMDRHSPYYCNVGGKVAQLLIRRRERIVWEEVESLEDLGKSDRGDNGFGSTDKINNDMGNKNTSSTTNEGLKEIDKQTNPVMYGWRCPVCGRVYSTFTSMCVYCGKNNNVNRIICKSI